MQESEIEAVRDWPTPTSVRRIRECLGITNFYQRFIRNYGKIVAPLTDLTKKDVAFSWNEATQGAFELTMAEIASKPILIDADLSMVYEVETDTSDYALGGQFGQRGENVFLHPIAFFSKNLHEPELNY